MEGKSRRSYRPIIILSVIFLVVVVIVGAVTWKVTKDAYEEDNDMIQTREDTNDTGVGKDENKDETEEFISKEELERQPYKALRLPRHIQPVHYDITMYPDFYGNAGEFYGNETIHLKLTKPSKFILIHVDKNYMTITDVTVYDNATNKALPIKKPFIYEKHQFLVVEGDVNFQEAVRVDLRFNGTMTKSIVGIYKSSYINSMTNQTRHLATSKFEPTYARRAFPCLDEPDLKATYTITLVHKPEYTALSNMNVDMTSPADFDSSLHATKFHRSVKMSTYLVCFIVCDFESVETYSKNGIRVRVFATPDKMNQTEYALDMANYTLNLYEDLFQMPYPLPKQDLIAIPDFVSGAMEHWGLITFRETALLYSPTKSTLSNKKRVATVVAHEMAHQWFGNIVTMKWWDDLWLNEGFASYMEYAGTEKRLPMDTFLVDDLLRVMDTDSQLSSHPIVVTVKDPAQITSVFDSISYSKGASVIRMLRNIMGTDNFFSGVAEYLKKFKWGNAETDDLWESLREVDPKTNVKAIMDTWTRQMGYPYVKVTMTTSSDGKTRIQAAQHRFLSDPNAVSKTKSPFGYKWYISLDYVTSAAGVKGVEVMNLTDVTFDLDLDLSGDGNWIKFNKEKNGYYRVLYPEPLWTKLARYLSNEKVENWKLSPSDRGDLLHDAFNLAAAGLTPYKVPLALTSYLTRENHYVPWKSAVVGGISYIGSMLRDDSSYEVWRNFMLEKIRLPLQKLGYNDTGSDPDRKLRALLFDLACSYDDATALSNVQEQFRDWLDNEIMPSVNLRPVVYSYGMENFGTERDFEKVWKKYLVESSPSEKDLLLLSLTRTSKPYLIAKLLEFAVEEEGIRRQDFFTVVSRLGNNHHATHIVWDWMRKNYSALEKRFTSTDRYFGRMAYYLVRSFKTERRLNEVKDFFKEHRNEGSSKRYRQMGVEDIIRNIYWIRTFRLDVVSWIVQELQLSASKYV